MNSILLILGSAAFIATLAAFMFHRRMSSRRQASGELLPKPATEEKWIQQHRARVAKFPLAIQAAHKHCTNHRTEVLESALCGCFYCLKIFEPAKITDWVDTAEHEEGTTALCPYCGIDSVIGDKSGIALTPDFLREMNREWFQKTIKLE
jgi:hypothetical protein